MKKVIVAALAAMLLILPATAAAAEEASQEVSVSQRAELMNEAYAAAADFIASDPEFQAWATANNVGPAEVIRAIEDWLGGTANDGQYTGTNEAYAQINMSTEYVLGTIGLALGCVPGGLLVGGLSCAFGLAAFGLNSTTQAIYARVYAVESFQYRQLARTVSLVNQVLTSAGTGPQCIYGSVFIYCCEASYSYGYRCWYQTEPNPE